MKIYIANNVEALSSINPDATVEAEYGLNCVNGSILTIAHHGPRSERPCPCSLPNFPVMGIGCIGISHVDLDTIGGLMAIMGTKPMEYDWVRDFWRVAAEIDVRGIHHISDMDLGICPDMVINSLNAFYAFSEVNRISAPRDGSVEEVNLDKFFQVITDLLTYDKCRGGIDDHEHEVWCSCPDYEGFGWDSSVRLALIEKGKLWERAKDRLEEESYIGTVGADILVRASEQFTAHLYSHNNRLHKAVVSFSLRTNSITVSVCDPIPGFHAGEFCQRICGEGAGGHAGIGGSPRGKQLTMLDAEEAALHLAILFK